MAMAMHDCKQCQLPNEFSALGQLGYLRKSELMSGHVPVLFMCCEQTWGDSDSDSGVGIGVGIICSYRSRNRGDWNRNRSRNRGDWNRSWNRNQMTIPHIYVHVPYNIHSGSNPQET